MQYPVIPTFEKTAWSIRRVACGTVSELLMAIASDGIEVSDLYTVKGRTIYPGDITRVLDAGTEIIVATEDGDEVPNYLVIWG